VSTLLLLAFLSGAGLAIQGALNTRLRVALGAPVLAALVSFLVGTVVLAVALLAAREHPPELSAWLHVPWWAWLGGVLGAVYVVMTVLVIPRAGAAATLGLAVVGQLLASLVLDGLGILGVPRHPLNPARLLGALLLLGGVVLVQRF
jgi:bacterial/archaeal transporter family-2 protein